MEDITTPLNEDKSSLPSTASERAGTTRIALALFFGTVLGFTQGSLGQIVIPQEIGYFLPKHAALASGLVLALGCVTSLAAPLVGRWSDGIGSRRKPLITGALLMTTGLFGMTASVQFFARSLPVFFGYSCAFLLLTVGTMVVNTSLSGLLADYSELHPEFAGKISAIYSLYQVLGAAAGYVVAGVVAPLRSDDHHVYWIILILSAIGDVGLLLLPVKVLKVLSPMQPSTSSSSGDDADGGWFSPQYKAWRFVVGARVVFFVGLGLFGSSLLYYFQDHTEAGPSGASKVMTYIAVISLLCSLLSAWPAGKLTDKVGAASVSILGSCIMGIVLFCIPFLHVTTSIIIAVPFYGAAQQFFNVADMGLVVRTLPHPEKKARDMGGWSAGMSVGTAAGNIFSASILSQFKESVVHAHMEAPGGSHNSSSLPTPERLPYKLLGYRCVYIPGAFLMLLSCYLIWMAGRTIRQAESRREREGGSFVEMA